MNTPLYNYIRSFYRPQEFPALDAQMRDSSRLAALQGQKILDGTPVFRNTLVKYCALLHAGSKLTVSVGRDIPCDPKIAAMLPEFGIRVADEKILSETFDVVADCAGRHRQVASRCGYAELTRSGLEYYRGCRQAVFSVDSGILKHFETALGTGESFVRAMEMLNHRIAGKKILVFGGGKVGGGTAFCAARAGAVVTVVDFQRPELPDGCNFLPATDIPAVTAAINGAWCVVSATGIAGALKNFAPALRDSDALIANMGVEDEFSEIVPDSRVLNGKRPLNFMLDEPTRLCYIDPSMALSNAALVQLLNGSVPPGISAPSAECENMILDDIRSAGMLNDEIGFVLSRRKKL